MLHTLETIYYIPIFAVTAKLGKVPQLFSMIFLYVAGVIFIYHAVVKFVNGTVYIIFWCV